MPSEHIPQKPVFSSRRLEQQWMRTQAVQWVRSGLAPTDVARHFGVTVRAVFKWVATFNDGGHNALAARMGSGRPTKLTPEQLQWIADTVRDQTPDQLKFSFGLWTLRLIGELIHRQFGFTLSKPTLIKTMRNLGFTAQRPLHRAFEQDAALVQAWHDERLPQLKARAKKLGATLMFADEAGMRSDHHAGTTWAPMGRTPIVRSTGQRVSVQMLSAISTLGELHFMLHEGSVNAEVFTGFLRLLMQGRDKPVLLVVDGCSIHKAKVVNDFVASTDGKLELHFLPPYSPQLNPDEQVWKNVKERVAKQIPTDKFHLRTLIHEALTRLKNMPDLVKNLFRHPECGNVL